MLMLLWLPSLSYFNLRGTLNSSGFLKLKNLQTTHGQTLQTCLPLCRKLELQLESNPYASRRLTLSQGFGKMLGVEQAQLNLTYENLGQLAGELLWTGKSGWELLLKQGLGTKQVSWRVSFGWIGQQGNGWEALSPLANSISAQQEPDIKELEAELLDSQNNFFSKLILADEANATLNWYGSFLPSYDEVNKVYEDLELSYEVQAQANQDKVALHKLEEIHKISLIEAECTAVGLACQGIIFPWVGLERLLNFFHIPIEQLPLNVALAFFDGLPLQVKGWVKTFQANPVKSKALQKTEHAFAVLQKTCSSGAFFKGDPKFGKNLGTRPGKIGYSNLGLRDKNRRVLHEDPEVNSSLTWLFYLTLQAPNTELAECLEEALNSLPSNEVDAFLASRSIDRLALFYSF